MPLFPKEHGAYGQMAFPLLTSLLTSLIVTGITVGSLLFVLAVIAGFIAHEPLLVVLGLRGPRAKREDGRTAMWWLALLVIVLAAAGLVSFRWMPAGHRWTVALPLVPSLYLFWAAISGHGKSTTAEVAVAIAFSLTAVPLCLFGGPSVATGVIIAIAFAANFVLATLAVRAVIVKVRGGGDPRQAALIRRSVFVLSGVIAAALGVVAAVRALPAVPLISVVPGIAVALWIASNPPPPSRLRAVGWTLVTTSAVTAALLIVTLWSLPQGPL
jgi:hypothetical protein